MSIFTVFTVGSREAIRASAVVHIDHIYTLSTIPTGPGQTLIVIVTDHPPEAVLEVVIQVCEARN